MRPKPCECCGELIAIPVPRKTGEIICEACWEDESEKNKRKRYLGPSESGEAADRRYPYAGPVREIESKPAWVQRNLWTKPDYIHYINRIRSQADTLYNQVEMLEAEMQERFGKGRK